MGSDPAIQAARMICKSIDALTMEINLLRRELKRKDMFETCKNIENEKLEIDGLDRMPKVSPLPNDSASELRLLAEGKDFQL